MIFLLNIFVVGLVISMGLLLFVYLIFSRLLWVCIFIVVFS